MYSFSYLEPICCSHAQKSLQMVTAGMKLKDTLWEKSCNQPTQYIKKPRHYLANKFPSSQVFTVVMYGCESWTIKKAEYRRTDDFKPWCLRRLLRVRWTARSSNQSILKEISAECSWKD